MTITDPNAPSSGESSGASFTTGESTQSVTFSARNATAGKTAYYRIFDMQGRPLFAGHQKPAKMPAARVIVVEYTTAGTLKRRYVQ